MKDFDKTINTWWRKHIFGLKDVEHVGFFGEEWKELEESVENGTCVECGGNEEKNMHTCDCKKYV